jgi:hypothetical protein
VLVVGLSAHEEDGPQPTGNDGDFAVYFGLKGNLIGSIGVAAGIAIAVSGVLYWAGQKNTSA